MTREAPEELSFNPLRGFGPTVYPAHSDEPHPKVCTPRVVGFYKWTTLYICTCLTLIIVLLATR